VATQRKTRELVEEAGREERTPGRGAQLGEVLEIGGLEGQVLDPLERLAEPAEHREGTTERSVAEAELERRRQLVTAGAPVAARHGQLVQVGEQRAARRAAEAMPERRLLRNGEDPASGRVGRRRHRGECNEPSPRTLAILSP
jgi:hypothetical protein